MLSFLTLGLSTFALVSAQYGGDYGAASSSASPAVVATSASASAMTPASSAASAPAAIQTVIVGGGPLVYSPQSLMVAQGGKVVFQFEAKNHSVSQSTFATPCHYATGGLNSGFVPASAAPYPTFELTVTDATKPLYFYCMQGMHCASGMVFIINPIASEPFAMFAANAVGTNSTLAPASLVGMGVSAASAATTPVAMSSGAVVIPAYSTAAPAASVAAVTASGTVASVAPAATSAKSSAGKLIASGLGLFGAVVALVM